MMTQAKTGERAAVGPWALLVLGEGVMGLHRLPAEGEVVVGRSVDAGVRLPHPSLSRQHVRLRMVGRTVTVEDLGSRHGTAVAGHSLPPGIERILSSGEMLQLGAVSVGLVRAGR
jgi:pSer/pThr/pTyr-binding forkhead associated (FHA) protein